MNIKLPLIITVVLGATIPIALHLSSAQQVSKPTKTNNNFSKTIKHQQTHTKVFELILKDKTCVECNLIGIDLSGVDLSGVDFSRADFSQANLSDSNLENAKLKLSLIHI